MVLEFKKKSFLALGLFLALAQVAFAEIAMVRDLKPAVREEITRYLCNDRACLGNARSSGVSYLEQIRDTATGQGYLRGKIWVNSCQDWGDGIHAYGDIVSLEGEQIAYSGCGYDEVQFLLPIFYNAGGWTANFEQITMDIGDDTHVDSVIRLTLRQDLPPLWAIAAAPLYLGAKSRRIEVNLAEIFSICASRLGSEDQI